MDALHCIDFLWINLVRFAIPSYLYIQTFRFVTWLDIYLFFVHHISNCLLCFNRFSATFLQFEKVWKSKLINSYIIGIIVLSFITSIPIMIKDRDIIYQNGQLITLKIHTELIIQRIILSIFMFITEIASSIVSIWTLHKIRSKQTKRFEKNLIMITCWHVVFELIPFYYEVANVFELDDAFSKWVYTYWFTFAFILFSSNTLTMLIINPKLRNDIKLFFKLKKPTKNEIRTISLHSKGQNNNRVIIV
ncbi:unnamed protein product [Caenorhabditis angaria]|uniref:Serpentine receptor class gamma n=1 Tax=Caenorhabditis angaria TaxID=860376 RepID=A0A9P1IE28_9PELO|nr:unnamed protein product [Caenorhabditis angaria]